MKRVLILLSTIAALFLSSYVGTEPNDVAYVVAIGFDKAENDNYTVTVQFARPTEISGGASEDGGEEGAGIVENVTVEAPDMYSALGLANHMVSKKLTLAHSKLIIFSAEVAKDGIEDIMETVSRNDEIRPDIYLSVARDSAKEYLTNVQPVIEVNPAKYYQLIYENDNSFGVPKSTAVDFYFNGDGRDRASTLSISGIINTGEDGDQKLNTQTGLAPINSIFESVEINSASEEEQFSGGENSRSEGDLSVKDNQDHQSAPMIDGGVGYRLRNYIAGQIGINEKNKSETMGMVVFDGNKAKFITGVLETELYKILTGEFKETFLTLKSGDDKTVTVTVSQVRKPKTDIDIKNKKITIDLFLESDLCSMPDNFFSDTDLDEFEKTASEEISAACSKFVEEAVKKNKSDILGFRNMAKSKFLTNSQYNREKDKIMDYNIEINTRFLARRTGLTVKEKK